MYMSLISFLSHFLYHHEINLGMIHCLKNESLTLITNKKKFNVHFNFSFSILCSHKMFLARLAVGPFENLNDMSFFKYKHLFNPSF